MEQQQTMLKHYLKTANQIIPPDQQDKYHILMGDQIIGTYNTFKELTRAEKEEFKHIACMKYIPLSKNVI